MIRSILVALCIVLFNQQVAAQSEEHMLGDWRCVRSKLAECGIIADVQLTHFYQGVSSGGVEETFKSGGKIDYNLTFLGEKLGLWKGLMVLVHAETQYGKAIFVEAGPFVLPNCNMIYPFPNQENTSITGLLLMQALSERYSFVAGKFNFMDLWDMVYPHTGRGIDGFMNLNSLIPGLPLLRFITPSFNGAGFLTMKGQEIQGGLLFFDTNNSTTTVGLNEMFNKGYNILGIWRFFTDWKGKPGSHMFLGSWGSGTYTSLDANGWTFIPGQDGGLIPAQITGACWCFGYFLDQVIWTDCRNDARNIRLFAGATLSDGNPSFARWGCMATLQGTGLFYSRRQDQMGIAYFYTELSKDFRQLVKPIVKLEELQGVELYYNAALTPWFHLTGDLQVVDSSNTLDDTSVILGLRANINF